MSFSLQQEAAKCPHDPLPDSEMEVWGLGLQWSKLAKSQDGQKNKKVKQIQWLDYMKKHGNIIITILKTMFSEINISQYGKCIQNRM